MSFRILQPDNPYPQIVRASSAFDEANLPPANIPTGFEADLPWLAPKMNLSEDPSDYFMRVTPIIVSDLPNRNGYAFPLNSLTEWNLDLHMQAYKGWKYCPMFTEHRSEDVTKALGVIADVSMRKLKGYANDRLWMVLILAAIDRTKNRSLAAEYESNKLNTVSMGANVDSLFCSYCGAPQGKCSHFDPETPVVFYELNGKIVHRNVGGVNPYETSIVRDPAVGLAVASDSKLFTY